MGSAPLSRTPDIVVPIECERLQRKQCHLSMHMLIILAMVATMVILHFEGVALDAFYPPTQCIQ